MKKLIYLFVMVAGMTLAAANVNAEVVKAKAASTACAKDCKKACCKADDKAACTKKEASAAKAK
jgi:hypothetical protein